MPLALMSSPHGPLRALGRHLDPVTANMLIEPVIADVPGVRGRLQQSVKRAQVFECADESGFYSQCLQDHLLSSEASDNAIVLEFGAGDGTPVLQALHKVRVRMLPGPCNMLLCTPANSCCVFLNYAHVRLAPVSTDASMPLRSARKQRHGHAPPLAVWGFRTAIR
jgi:hypothetical protein